MLFVWHLFDPAVTISRTVPSLLLRGEAVFWDVGAFEAYK